MESKFNTHGGYFSPKGYLRVDEGGSHEENPNGGVQIGVDPNGVPNMLEENEPVYNDYVFSDNIAADKDILVKYNIPAGYAGKLYSEIADAFVDEAEERPMDSISNNGLNVMLTRLRDAQEEQKQLKEQAEIEEELAGLSPEELAELEAMLDGQQEMPMQSAPANEMPIGEVPIMANGGYIRVMGNGTPGKLVPVKEPYTGTISQYIDTRTPVRRWIDNTVDNNSKLRSIRDGVRNFNDSFMGKVVDFVTPDFSNGIQGAAVKAFPSYAQEAIKDINVIGKIKDYSSGYEEALERIKKASKEMSKDVRKKLISDAEASANFYVDEMLRLMKKNNIKPLKQKKVKPEHVKKQSTGRIGKVVSSKPFKIGAATVGGSVLISGDAELEKDEPVVVNDDISIDDIVSAEFGSGGEMNRYVNGGQPIVYNPAWYTLPKKLDVGKFEYNNHYNNTPKVGDLMMGTGPKFDGFNPVVFDPNKKFPKTLGWKPDAITGLGAYTKPVGYVSDNDDDDIKKNNFNTLLRYADVVNNVITAGYNMAQPRDKYDFKRLAPRLTYMRAPGMIDPTFRPIDTNFAVNDVLSSGAGTVRSAMNSGAGPGVGTLLVSLDNNTTRNIGNAMEQVANYNNTGRNNVISQRNQNAFQRAQLMYEIARANANAQAEADRVSLQTDMTEQVMNNRSEQEWANAVGLPIGEAAKALSYMGHENVSRNMANSMFNYWIDENGVVHYYSPKMGLLKEYNG